MATWGTIKRYFPLQLVQRPSPSPGGREQQHRKLVATLWGGVEERSPRTQRSDDISGPCLSCGTGQNPKIPSQAASLACCVCFRSQWKLRYYRLHWVKVFIKRKQGWDYISVVWCLSGNHMAQNQNPKPTASQPKKSAKLKSQAPKYVYIMMAFINLTF